MKGGRQEARTPVVRSILRDATRVEERDEGRQILIVGAQRVANPRPDTGEPIQCEARGEKILGRPVGVALAGERMDKGDVVGQFGEVRDEVRDHLAGLPARSERILRSGQVSGRSLERHSRSARHGFVIPAVELRFVVPSLQLADGPGAKDNNDIPGLRGEVRRTRTVGVGQVCKDSAHIRLGCQKTLSTEQVGECDRAECGGAAAQKPAAVEQSMPLEG